MFPVVLMCFLSVNLASASNIQDRIIESDNTPWNGKRYYFKYRTENGLYREESGELKVNEDGAAYIDVRGKYAVPMGNTIKIIAYRANDKGYSIERPSAAPMKQLIKADVEEITAKKPLLVNRILSSQVVASLLG